jgi:hypothetical protein
MEPAKDAGETKPISAHQAGARDLESVAVRRAGRQVIGLQFRVVAGNVVQL